MGDIMRTFLAVLVVALLLWLGWSSLYRGPGQYVYVTQFGRRRHARTASATAVCTQTPLAGPVGAAPSTAAATLTCPRQVAHPRPDGRTIDKTLSVVAYLCWRCRRRWRGHCSSAASARRTGLDHPRQARARQLRRSSVKCMDDLVSTDAGRVTDNLEDLRKRLLHGTGVALRHVGGGEA
jgi:hypothetical protein